MSSVPIVNQELEVDSPEVPNPLPNVERPSALRMMASKCSSAAVVSGEGEAPSRASSVAVDGIGGGMWVARNM